MTLRDWFQLSLKEGLTVFRDQQFSADNGSEAVKRILDVRRLRDHQFPEDDGPMSHPVRPESYIEINNFYTATVYEKGAEIVRMLYVLLGKDAYYQAMKQYFKKFDGQAITIEDMLNVMQESSGRNLDQFKLWYQQAGTPILHVERRPNLGGLSLVVRQELPQTAGQVGVKKAQLIPFKVAFLGRNREALDSTCQNQTQHEHLLEITEMTQTFEFKGLPIDAIPSLLRGFTAPVKLKTTISQEESLIALAAETDSFNRYEAAQLLAEQMIGKKNLPFEYVDALKTLLRDGEKDPFVTSLSLQTPTVENLLNLRGTVDVEATFKEREAYLKQVGELCFDELLTAYRTLRNEDPKAMDGSAAGRRELRNTCLTLLAESGRAEVLGLVETHYIDSQTMTDKVAVLGIVASIENRIREDILSDFYSKWEHDILVIDKWFAAQAGSSHPEVLKHVAGLLAHRDFDMHNPNRVYTVFHSFAQINPYGFHHISGAGYAIVADYVLKIDGNNPQVASRLSGLLSRYQKFDGVRQSLIKAQLQRILNHPKLSSDVYEVVSKSLNS